VPLLSATRERANLIFSDPVAWEKNARLPRGVAAVLDALRFTGHSRQALSGLSDSEWAKALTFADWAGLTLILGSVCHEGLPAWVQERIGRNLAGNTERLARLRGYLAEISNRFGAGGIEYLVLKGFSQAAEYVSDPRVRMPFDIDLFAPRSSLIPARDALRVLGYEPLTGTEQLPADHLPPLIRKTGWQWRGDLFDPEIPGCVDLHFQFWDAATERFEAAGVGEFWPRRVEREGLPVLHEADRLGYAALHLLRHLLRASVRASHVYEIAYFLDAQAENDGFWNSWRELHPPELRRLEAVSFRLAASWFGGRVAPAAREEVERLSGDIPLWFDRYSASPVEGQFHPNKHELWLHFALLGRPVDRRRVFVRKMLPATLPGPVADVFVPDEQKTWWMRARGTVHYGVHLARRILHHARALPATLAHGAAWKWRSLDLPGPFWRFVLASSLYNVGLFLFYLLYNLYMLDRGYRENVLGLIASAFTAGNLAGVLPAAGLTHRFGLKRTVAVCFAGTAVVFLLRSFVSGEPALLASAFAGGVFFSVWAVCVSPVVAALTTERARPVGFSVIFGSGIGIGILGGVIGGRLPGWLARSGLAAAPAESKQLALMAAGVFAALALLPLTRLRLETPRSRETRSYPAGPFITRFLIAIGVWNFANGMFNPLFNAYFSRQFAMPVERIGVVFSISQAGQVAAVLLAPLALRKLGMVRGVAAMQFATALALMSLASGPAALAATALYAGYASLQYMSEPGIYSLLMNRVAPGERSGASALNFLVVFLAQTAAAWAAGMVVTRYGYPQMLAGAACLAVAGSVAFWRLLSRFGER